MTNTYTWTISSLDCYPTAESQTNVVFNAHWVAQATDPTGKYTASIYGACPLTYVAGSSFIAFDSLTEQQVLNWIYGAGVNQAVVQISLDKQIDSLVNPVVINPKLPWIY